MSLFGAIDLGASSGRVMAGVVKDGKLSLFEVHRFPNHARHVKDRLVWDFDNLFAEIRIGIRELGARAERMNLDVKSIGIDTWAVDYGLIRNGELIASPNCYRDPLNHLGVEKAHERVPFEELYAITGMQFLPFNSVYQILRQQELDPELLGSSEKMLLLPDLIGYLLTGELATERTNASTTGLLDAKTREWSIELSEKLGVDLTKFPELRNAGEKLGKLNPGFGRRLEDTEVVLVGSHDTGSAVVGVPAEGNDFAYLSSGTWSLLGTELDEPILSAESRAANFTNELGVDNKVRYLKNLSGLWLLSESIRFWNENGNHVELLDLLEQAAKILPTATLDVSDQSFIAPDEMPIKIARALEASGQDVPTQPAEFVAVILHSLAKSYAENLKVMRTLTGKTIAQLHVIGGGTQNQLLCQLTADYCEIPVLSGPTEATAIGNILVQARTAGLIGEQLGDIRRVIRNSDFEFKNYQPKRKAS